MVEPLSWAARLSNAIRLVGAVLIVSHLANASFTGYYHPPCSVLANGSTYDFTSLSTTIVHYSDHVGDLHARFQFCGVSACGRNANSSLCLYASSNSSVLPQPVPLGTWNEAVSWSTYEDQRGFRIEFVQNDTPIVVNLMCDSEDGGAKFDGMAAANRASYFPTVFWVQIPPAICQPSSSAGPGTPLTEPPTLPPSTPEPTPGSASTEPPTLLPPPSDATDDEDTKAVAPYTPSDQPQSALEGDSSSADTGDDDDVDGGSKDKHVPVRQCLLEVGDNVRCHTSTRTHRTHNTAIDFVYLLTRSLSLPRACQPRQLPSIPSQTPTLT